MKIIAIFRITLLSEVIRTDILFSISVPKIDFIC